MQFPSPSDIAVLRELERSLGNDDWVEPPRPVSCVRRGVEPVGHSALDRIDRFAL